MNARVWTGLAGLTLALFFTFIPGGADRFRDQAYLALLFLWGSWAFMMAERLTYWILPALLWAGYEGARIFAAPHSPYGASGVHLDATAASGMLWIMAVVTFLIYCSNEVIDILLIAFEWAAILGSVCILVGRFGGLFYVTSIDTAFTAMVFPLLIYRLQDYRLLKWLFLLLMIIAIYFTPGATGVYTTAMILIAWAIFYSETRKLSLFLSILSPLLILGAGYLVQGKTLFFSSGRLEIWKLIMSWWWDNSNIWRGTGLGTYEMIGTSIQRDAHIRNIFIYLHNDYLQVLFEQGIIGFVFLLIIYLVALKEAYNKPWVFLSLIGGGVVFMTQSALYIGCFGVFIGVLIREAFSDKLSKRDKLSISDLLSQWKKEDKKKIEDQKEFDRIVKKYLDSGVL